jgi:Outer membrane protein beta-barrel domain
MKEKTMLSILFVSFYCIVFAQANSTYTTSGTLKKESKMHYGFLSGINLNTIRQENLNTFLKENVTHYTGLSIGGYLKFHLNKLFAVKVLAQYDQNGYRLGNLSFTDASGTNIAPGNVTIKTTYLNFPVVGEFTFGNKIKYYINAGPYIGFLLSSNVFTKISSTSSSPASNTKSKTDAFKKTNIGVSFGTGALIPISKIMHLHFGIKNNIGLLNIAKPILSDNSDFKTNAFSILAGIDIGL